MLGKLPDDRRSIPTDIAQIRREAPRDVLLIRLVELLLGLELQPIPIAAFGGEVLHLEMAEERHSYRVQFQDKR